MRATGERKLYLSSDTYSVCDILSFDDEWLSRSVWINDNNENVQGK